MSDPSNTQVGDKHCIIEGCNSQGIKNRSGTRSFIKGYCAKHYLKLRKYGDATAVKQIHDNRRADNRYLTWQGIRSRCYNMNSISYKSYGGRGIKMCDRWLEPGGKGYINFIEDMGQKPTPQHSIDRIDNDGDYEPSNCRWATIHEQAANKQDSNEFVGVTYSEKTLKWKASFSYNHNRVDKELDTQAEAVAYRKALERMYLKMSETQSYAVEEAVTEAMRDLYDKRFLVIPDESTSIYVVRANDIKEQLNGTC